MPSLKTSPSISFINVIGISGMKNRISTAAQDPFSYKKAGYGQICELELYKTIDPGGKN